MTTLTIEVPDALMAKLARQERPVQEVIVAVLEDMFGEKARNQASPQPTREQVISDLVQAGLICEPGTLDSPAAKAWRDLPQTEKRRHLAERKALRFVGSPGATAVLKGRR